MRYSKALAGITVLVAVLIIAGLFTVYMFVRAHTVQSKARDLDMAALAAQSVIEEYKAGIMPASKILLDKNLEATTEFDEDGFSLNTEVSDDGAGLFTVRVTVIKNKPYPLERIGNIVFSLETTVYKGIQQ